MDEQRRARVMVRGGGVGAARALACAWSLALALGCGGAPAVVVEAEPEVAPTPVRAELLPVSGSQGLILAEQVGGTVEMRALETGDTVALSDGEQVELVQVFAGEGLGRAEAQITARGQLGVIPNARLVTEDRLSRKPEQELAVFTALTRCEPTCVTEVWVVHRDGWRVRVTDEGPTAPASVVHPRGFQLAISGGALWLVDIPGGRVRQWKEFTAPTYHDNGVLYMRGVGTNDAVYELGEFGNGVLVHEEPGVRSRKAVGDPAPVRFEDGGKTLVATFERGGDPVERRVSR